MRTKKRQIVVTPAIVKPYDFRLSLRAVASFQPRGSEPADHLGLATRVEGTPTLIEVEPVPGEKAGLRISATPGAGRDRVRALVEWVLFAELDLRPFYRRAAKHPGLSAITEKLYGLKPMRPISLFEMAVIAITEQQISLVAAYRIRNRMVQRFGTPLGGQWIFPEPPALADARLSALRACGLSRQKADYARELARNITRGGLDLDVLKSMADDKARELIMSWRGFGRWSADYLLIRGLARPDSVPVDDLAVRSVVGEYLGNGSRVTPLEVARKLEPFRPYRGLVAFYLLAEHRLGKMRTP